MLDLEKGMIVKVHEFGGKWKIVGFDRIDGETMVLVTRLNKDGELSEHPSIREIPVKPKDIYFDIIDIFQYRLRIRR